MAGNPHKGNEIATIDVALVTIETDDSKEIGLKTASKIEVEIGIETTESVKLIVKGVLIAQKPEESTITGNVIKLTDNVFIPEVALIMQGGTIVYKTPSQPNSGVASYEPPVAGSSDKGKVFTTNVYSAIYDAAGLVTGYEKISYPNCRGVPIGLNSEDGVFRAPEYTINSAPNKGQAPYKIEYVDDLPTLDDVPASDA